MFSDDNTVDLTIIATTLADSMQIINELAKNKTLTPDLLVQCELVASQFKNEFGEELLKTHY